MSATTLAQGEHVDCLDCDGAGFTWIPKPGPDLDYEEGTCTTCRGEGVVDADAVWTCDGCQASFWAGSGCEHNDRLCPTCGERCRECADDRRAEADEAHARDFIVLQGGGWS